MQENVKKFTWYLMWRQELSRIVLISCSKYCLQSMAEKRKTHCSDNRNPNDFFNVCRLTQVEYAQIIEEATIYSCVQQFIEFVLNKYQID